ncbi:MAG: MBL fold metallo-hydrolase [Candidatus Aenigmarchaeota archaeon]|nr:MBL fold metallo-hydrolase [Candidatus Aenigmarchaeota archaeon]
MQIIKGIDLIKGYGYDSNVYLIEDLLIDTGTGLSFAEMKKSVPDASKIKTIVNTHHHFDHSGGDNKFRDWTKAEIAVHASDKDALENGETLAEMFNTLARVITVDRVLADGDILKTSNFTFRVVLTPGHTPGSICLYDKNKKVLISGDTLFSDAIGRTDLPGGNSDEMKNSLQKLSKLDINYLLPGHGEPKIGGVNFLVKQVLAGTISRQKFA